MAFKTDTIKLKVEGSNPGTGTNGELSIVGSAGNLALKYYDSDGGGSWKAVDSSSALTISNFHANTYQTAAEVASSFGDNDTSFMTAAAIDDRINAAVLSNSNTVKHNAWSGDVELSSGTTINNLIFYSTTNQGNTHALAIPPVGSFGAFAQVQVINGSSDDMHITRKTPASDASFNLQAGGGTVNQIDIGLGQKALFLKTTAANWEVIVLSL